jgi:hypothetical protein
VFARAGVRFESHLGHVFSLFRGLWASECGQTFHICAPSGPFLLVAELWPSAPSTGGSSLCYFFIVVHGVGNMTRAGCERLLYFVVAFLIRNWLQTHPRFHMHFTRTYSSWLNLVERSFERPLG